MTYLRPGSLDHAQLPLLMESLMSDTLWGMMEQMKSTDEHSLPMSQIVSFNVLNEKRKTITAVPVFTSQVYAERFIDGFDSPVRERLICPMFYFGEQLLKRLINHPNNIVIDHGQKGLIMYHDSWQAGYTRYLHTPSVALAEDLSDAWCAADADDFPALRDLLTSFLHHMRSIAEAYLLWMPSTPGTPRQLCLITIQTGFVDHHDSEYRIRKALPFFAVGLKLPPLAYLPLGIGPDDRRYRKLPDNVKAFYNEELSEALECKPKSHRSSYFDETW
ncbi:MAG TPA: hypothetical protein VIF82_12900 [Burkholderiaceae bacterium]|jgi:hypothetical protein